MPKLLAKNFSTREELETKIRQTTGEAPEKKDNHTIEGTRKELKNLRLSDKNMVYGWSVTITDTPTTFSPQKERPDRGQIHKFGLQNRPQ
jgi:hypothetical protein